MCRRNKECTRSAKKKSGPAKGTKYAARKPRSQDEHGLSQLPSAGGVDISRSSCTSAASRASQQKASIGSRALLHTPSSSSSATVVPSGGGGCRGDEGEAGDEERQWMDGGSDPRRVRVEVNSYGESQGLIGNLQGIMQVGGNFSCVLYFGTSIDNNSSVIYMVLLQSKVNTLFPPR